MDARYDIVIVGAGMAGASLAARLAGAARVLVIEAEERPGFHATGRSAAFWTESYGGLAVQPLTTASGPMLRALGVLTPRGALTLGRESDRARIADFARDFAQAGVEMHVLDRAAIDLRVPYLRDHWVCAAWEPSTCDIDVAALHQHYLGTARRNGAELRCRSALRAARRDGGHWSLELADGARVRCDILVNAAGAWADKVAGLAGVLPIGIRPYRRTIAQLSVARAVPESLPLVLDISESFYFKPESGRIWLSPHDETPTEPCDAAPDELDIALAIDRFEQAVDWPVRRVEHKWAGLRSFAPDRVPVYGFDPREAGFFWFAGQGGFGIQTAPAAAELAGWLLTGEGAGDIDPQTYSPARFA